MLTFNTIKKLAILPISVTLGLGYSPIVKAQETTAPTVANQTVASDLQVSAKQREKETIVDVTVNLSGSLTDGGKVQVQLLDNSGKTLASIPYDLQKGYRQMTAWFEMAYYPVGDYQIKVSHTSPSGQGTSSVQTVHYNGK